MKKIFKSFKDFFIWLFTTIVQLIKRILSTIAFFFGAWYSFIVFFIMNQVKIYGRGNIPHKTKLLFVSNHTAFIDSFVIGLAIVNIEDFFFNYRRIPWNAAASEFWFSSPFKKFLFDLLKCKPMIRKTTSLTAFEKSVREMIVVLKDGNLVLFFEGGRTRNGEIGECKTGVPLIIRLARPTVIPIFLDGVSSIMPVEQDEQKEEASREKDSNRLNGKKTKKRLNLFKIRSGNKVRVIIGKPIDFSDIAPLEIDLERIISSKEKFPTEVYSKLEIETIKARVKARVEELDPKRKLEKND